MQWWLIGYLPITGPAQWTPFQGTQAQAEARVKLAVNGQLKGPYATRADAEAAIKTLPKNLQQTPTGAQQAIQQTVSNAVPGLQQIGTFFASLGQANTWIRVAETLLGLILIAAGLARITHAVPAATRVARAVGTKGLA